MLNKDWKKILTKAWSIRFIVLAGILSGLEVALPYLNQFIAFPPGIFSLVTILVITLAFIARIISQKEFLDEEK